MAGVVNIGKIQTCVGLKDAFELTFQPATGVSLTGAALACQIRSSAQPSPPALTPTIETSMSGANLVAVFSWTAEQSLALVAGGTSYGKTTTYQIEIDLALSDDPTEPVIRFVGQLVVAPGGQFVSGT